MKLLFESWRGYLLEEESTFDIGAHLSSEELEKIKDWAGLPGDIEHIGTGTMGSAYLIGDKVLKLTKDFSEATTAAAIIGLGHPNIYDVYAVGSRPGVTVKTGLPWVIITEYLLPPTREMRFAAKEIYNDIRSGSKISQRFYNWSGFDALSPDEQKILSSLISFVPPMLDREKVREHVSEIATALTALARKGIRFNDVKPSNIVSKGGQAAIIDLGRAAIQKSVEIPEIK
jgi:serine/threonine protein kinase